MFNNIRPGQVNKTPLFHGPKHARYTPNRVKSSHPKPTARNTRIEYRRASRGAPSAPTATLPPYLVPELPSVAFPDIERFVTAHAGPTGLTDSDKIFLNNLDMLCADRDMRHSEFSNFEKFERGEEERKAAAEECAKAQRKLQQEALRKETAETEAKARFERFLRAVSVERGDRMERVAAWVQQEREQVEGIDRETALREERARLDEAHRRSALKTEASRRNAALAEEAARAKVAARTRAAFRDRLARAEAAAREHAARLEAARVQAAREEALRAEAARAQAGAPVDVVDVFDLYERKWTALKTGQDLSDIPFTAMPWPVFGNVEDWPDVTRERVAAFVLHSGRSGAEGKSAQDRLKAELLRWHPDKFEGLVLAKVKESERESVKVVAGAYARLLMELLKNS